MIPKSGHRFSEKIMLKQKDERRVSDGSDSTTLNRILAVLLERRHVGNLAANARHDALPSRLRQV